MPVNFTAPIAHQTGSDYSAFNNAITLGRPYRQPLQTAPNPNQFATGLELFLSSTGDVAVLYSWLDGILTWQHSIATQASRLILTTDPRILTGSKSLSKLNLIEALPQKAIYENVDQASVQRALEALLNAAYSAAAADPTHPDRWHPCMRMVVSDAGTKSKLKVYLDNNTPVATTIITLVTGFLLGTAGSVMSQVSVQAGDVIGRVAPYLASDPLPTSPAFPLGVATDPNRARRLTFQTWDNNGQAIHPLYYLHAFMRRMLLPAANRIVNSLTNIVAGDVLAHPLVTLLPALSAAALPPARERVAGVSAFPLGSLNTFHRYPIDAPISKLEWRYTDTSEFEAQAHVAGTKVPPMDPSAQRINRVTALWTTHGTTISAISDALQIPTEVIFGLIGAEAPGSPANPNQFDERAVRLEPLLPRNRSALLKAGVTADLELEYDKVIGVQGTINQVVMNANGTTRLDITLAYNRKWGANFLKRSGFFMLVADVDRVKISGNKGSRTSTTTYQITVEDAKFESGFASNGTQRAGDTRYYSLAIRSAGKTTELPTQLVLGRAGTLRRLQVKAKQNTLNGATTIKVLQNGTATTLAVTLAAGAKSGDDTTHMVPVAVGDRISMEVITRGTTGELKNLTFTLLNAPATGDAWVLEGFSTSVPDPWNGAKSVRERRRLTWDQLVTVVDGTNGERISPGIIQTLISTARGVLPYLNAIQPSIYAATGIPAPPTTAGGFFNSWLLSAPNSILVGAAYIRQGYNKQATRFDLPVVGSAYNSGQHKVDTASPWGLKYFGNYVENAGPGSNAAASLFNDPATTPISPVRFIR
jgi:hypothetical protein